MAYLFNGFRRADFSVFQEVKRQNPKFNEERKIVWQKMQTLKLILDSQLQSADFPLEGQISRYWICSGKSHVNGIWIAYTDVKPFWKVCQLNCGIYRNHFFAGIQINYKAKSHLQNVLSFAKDNQKEFLSIVKKLDTKYVYLNHGDWEAGGSVSASDIVGLIKSLESECGWVSIGEWYPNNERFFFNGQFISRIPKIFETLYPLYLVFSGKRPAGTKKTDKLLRVSDARKKDLSKAEKEIASEINNLDEEELHQLIVSINEQNRKEFPSRHTSNTNGFRRNPALSAALKKLGKDKCQVCNTNINVRRGYFCDTHHIIPLRSGGLDVSDNILVLCPNHHRFFDRSKTELISRNKSSLTLRVDGKTQTLSLLSSS